VEGITGEMAKDKKEGRVRRKRKGFVTDNRGVGVVEVILILVILIGLVLIFKSEIESLVGTVFDAISGKTNTILS